MQPSVSGTLTRRWPDTGTLPTRPALCDTMTADLLRYSSQNVENHPEMNKWSEQRGDYAESSKSLTTSSGDTSSYSQSAWGLQSFAGACTLGKPSYIAVWHASSYVLLPMFSLTELPINWDNQIWFNCLHSKNSWQVSEYKIYQFKDFIFSFAVYLQCLDQSLVYISLNYLT